MLKSIESKPKTDQNSKPNASPGLNEKERKRLEKILAEPDFSMEEHYKMHLNPELVSRLNEIEKELIKIRSQDSRRVPKGRKPHQNIYTRSNARMLEMESSRQYNGEKKERETPKKEETDIKTIDDVQSENDFETLLNKYLSK